MTDLRVDDAQESTELPEPRSFLGLPLRMLLALGSFGLPLLAIAWFSATHAWPPPPPCGYFAVFGCPSAPYPVQTQGLDWLDMAGPILGVLSGLCALKLRREAAEPNIAIGLFRYATPLVGFVVSIISAIQISVWITHGGLT